MVEEIYKNIFRIGVPLEGNPLKEVNSYFIRGAENELLIDTGFRRDSCRIPLEEGLRKLNSNPDKRDVYVTHMHADHSGMADLFVGKGRHIYMSEPDLTFCRSWLNRPYMEKDYRFLEEGFTEEMLDELGKNTPSNIYIMRDWSLPCIQSVQDGKEITVGDYCFKVVLVPGHTKGNTMLWEEKHGIMFTGDHILYDITPNIIFWEGNENIGGDALGAYLDSLRKAKTYPVRISFPGHRKSGDYQTRIDELLIHHKRRIEEAYRVVCQEPGLRAIDIAGKMSWRIRSSSWEDFPLVQKRFAVGECVSHLEYLMARGKVIRRMLNDKRWHYGPPEWKSNNY